MCRKIIRQENDQKFHQYMNIYLPNPMNRYVYFILTFIETALCFLFFSEPQCGINCSKAQFADSIYAGDMRETSCD